MVDVYWLKSASRVGLLLLLISAVLFVQQVKAVSVSTFVPQAVCPGGTTSIPSFFSTSLICPLSPGTDILSQDLWEVKLTPGKGRGVFARRTIQRGTHLLTETALFAVAPPALVPGRGFELAAMAAEVERRYLLLPPASRQEYLSCHEERFPGDGDTQDQVEGHHLMAIFRSNAYTRRDGLVGIYPKVALINHSCQPNVLNTDVEDGRRVIVATRDIQKGEEIVTTYIPLLMDTTSRNQRLQQYGFRCNCMACQTEASDQQRAVAGGHLQELEEFLPQAASSTTSWEEEELTAAMSVAVGMAEALAAYVEEEGFADYFVKTSRLAVEYALLTHDETKARWWGRKHLQHHEVVSPDSIQARQARQLLNSI